MSDAPWRATLDGVVVACRLTPKGGRDAIDGALRLIADKAGVPPSRARLVAGAKSRLKQVALTGDPAALIAKLERG